MPSLFCLWSLVTLCKNAGNLLMVMHGRRSTSRCLIASSGQWCPANFRKSSLASRRLSASNAKHRARRALASARISSSALLFSAMSPQCLINGFCGLRSITITGLSWTRSNPCAEYHLDRRSLSGIKNRA